MTGPIVLPAIFQAIDRITAPLKNMGSNIVSFGNKVGGVVGRAERGFNKLTGSINTVGKHLLSFVSTMALAAAVVAGIAYSVRTLKEYDTEIANLSAVTGATGKDLDHFKTKIQEVAAATKSGAVETAQAFTIVDNNMPELHKSADGLAKVTEAAITLGKAGRIELGPAAEALTISMNQYGLSANQAAMATDALAAGQVAGSSMIKETAEALQVFGGVAASVAKVTFAESVALVELVSKFQKGAEAGTGLRNVLTNMSTIRNKRVIKELAGLGVNMKIINDRSKPLNDRLKELSKIKNSPGSMLDVFGKRGIGFGAEIFKRLDEFQDKLNKLNQTGIAKNMAETNMDSLSGSIDKLTAKWTRLITTDSNVSTGMNDVKKSINFVTDHMETLVTWGGRLIGLFVTMKVAFYAFNVVAAITAFLQGFLAIATGTATEALYANKMAMAGATAAQWLWNAAMYANPIGLIILGIVALIALIYTVIKKWDDWGAAITIFLGPLGMVISFAMSLYKNWHLVTEAFKDQGILGAVKAIGVLLLDVILAPLQQILEIAGHLPGKIGAWALEGANSIASFRASMGVMSDRAADSMPDNALTDKELHDKWDRHNTPFPQRYVAVNPKTAQNDAVVNQLFSIMQKQQVEVVVSAAPGTNATVNKNSTNQPKVSSTIGGR